MDGRKYKLEKRIGRFTLMPFYSLADKVDGELYAVIQEKQRIEKEKREEEERRLRKLNQDTEYKALRPHLDSVMAEHQELKGKLSSELLFNSTLFEQFEQWQKSKELRQFIEAKQLTSVGKDISEWLERAEALADYYDPFSDVAFKRTTLIENRIKEITEELQGVLKKFDLLTLDLGVKKPEAKRHSWW